MTHVWLCTVHNPEAQSLEPNTLNVFVYVRYIVRARATDQKIDCFVEEQKFNVNELDLNFVVIISFCFVVFEFLLLYKSDFFLIHHFLLLFIQYVVGSWIRSICSVLYSKQPYIMHRLCYYLCINVSLPFLFFQ